jgi:hypothetical protein
VTPILCVQAEALEADGAPVGLAEVVEPQPKIDALARGLARDRGELWSTSVARDGAALCRRR